MEGNQDFQKLFRGREFAELRGRNNTTIIRLVALLTLTFCALGFAIGGMEQLGERMRNPFTRWVDFTVDSKAEKRFTEMSVFLNAPETREAYGLDGYSNWNRYWLFLHDRRHDPLRYPVDSITRWQMGRTIDFGDELFFEILDPRKGNLIIRHDEYFDDSGDPLTNCGIIVTARLLGRLGYLEEEYPGVAHVSAAVGSSTELLHLPIMAIVRNLPSRSEFISSHHLDNILQGAGYDHLLRRNSTDTSRIRILSEQTLTADKLKDLARRAGVTAAEELSVQSFPLKVDAGRSFTEHTLILPKGTMAAQRDTLLAMMTDRLPVSSRSSLDCSDEADRITKSMFRTFNFESLNGIRGFQEAIERKFDLRLPMENVENRENFRLVARLTSLLGFGLFVFGLLAIWFYLGNLMRNHVRSIQPHLGTFKAMGLPDATLRQTYVGIALKLLAISAGISLVAAFIIGKALDIGLLRIDFRLWHWAILAALGFIFLSLWWRIRSQLNSVFRHTPGDLIYERQNTK